MAKIIKINGDVVSIGTNDCGIKKVRITYVNFTPSIGDEVEILKQKMIRLLQRKKKK